jgi:hypothetical protein
MTPLLSAIKSNYMVFAFESNDGSAETVNKSLSNIKKLCVSISQGSQKNNVDLTTEEYRIYMKSPKTSEREYFALMPHISTGKSPFMFYEKDEETVGIFVKIMHSRSLYCTKTINLLARKLYEESILEDIPITLKAAKSKINEDVFLNNNPHDVPLIERTSFIYTYIDIENGCLLAKSSKRDQDSINNFFELLRRTALLMDEKGFIKVKDTVALAFEERLNTTHYVNWALNNERAFGSYNVNEIVNFYANQSVSDEICEACPVEPTMTASFFSVTNPDQKINLKNSMNIMMSPEKQGHVPSFRMLQEFSDEKDLNIATFKGKGEIPKSVQLSRYCAAYPDSVDDTIRGDYVDVLYDTKSKQGNIMFKVTGGITFHIEAAKRLLQDYFSDNSVAVRDMEDVMLSEFSGLLAILHDSTTLFLSLYINANKISGEFSSDIEKALN